MPVDAVWVIITIPKKEYEKELRKVKIKNIKNNNLNISDDSIESSHNDNQPFLEKILSDALDELQIEDVVWAPTRSDNFFQVYFPLEVFENDSILNILKSKGIGTKSETSIGYIPFNLFFYEELSDSDDDSNEYNLDLPADMDGHKLDLSKKQNYGFKEVTQNFLKSVTSRLTVAQVVEGVKSGAEVTFDFCAYTLMAAFIAAFGLVNNDPVNIAASMMIEPIMGTVMAITFGLVIEDRKLLMLGIWSNIISLVMSLISGFVIGLIFFIWMTEWNPSPNGLWPTAEMQSRGTVKGIVYGILLALPCGGAIAVTLLNENHAALVGVAVASTFLPPFINTGLLWAMAVHLQIRGLSQQIETYNISGQVFNLKPAWVPQQGYSVIYSNDMRKENALLGCMSMALTGVNIVCMLLVAYVVLKIKEVAPLEKIAPGTRRFFTQDIKMARKYNRKSMAFGKDQPLGQQILEEWAEITGIDKNQLMEKSEEARITQLQTLYDIAEDVEADETYQRVMKNAMGKPYADSALARRLTQPVLQGISKINRQKSQKRRPTIWNVEQDTSPTMAGRRYTVTSQDKPKEDEESNASSPYSTISSGRGFRPNELRPERGRRRSSKMLKKSLKNSVHSPYSIWPSAQQLTRSDSVMPRSNSQRVRRRTIFSPKLEPQIETNELTGF